MTPDIAFFRKVMGQFTTGVTVVTTRSQEGIAGLTVNSFTSVSLDPLLILICVDLRSHALPFIRSSGIFAVNILTMEQEALSNCFASAAPERFSSFCYARYHVAATGAPILADTMGFVDTRVEAEYPGGDHAIFLGKVEAMGYDGQTFFVAGVPGNEAALLTPTNATELNGKNGHGETTDQAVESSPLLYYRGQYYHLSSRYHHRHPDLSPAKGQRDE